MQSLCSPHIRLTFTNGISIRFISIAVQGKILQKQQAKSFIFDDDDDEDDEDDDTNDERKNYYVSTYWQDKDKQRHTTNLWKIFYTVVVVVVVVVFKSFILFTFDVRHFNGMHSMFLFSLSSTHPQFYPSEPITCLLQHFNSGIP